VLPLKRFVFRLQRFLDILLKRLEQKKIELSGIMQELKAKEEEITAQKKRIVDTQRVFHDKMLSTSVVSSDLIGYTHYIDTQYETLKKLFQQRIEIRNRLERCQEEYTEIRRNVKMFEKLKEKKFAKYVEESELEERKEMDEIAIRRVRLSNFNEAGENHEKNPMGTTVDR
jgi:flagellar export protein FliJ